LNVDRETKASGLLGNPQRINRTAATLGGPSTGWLNWKVKEDTGLLRRKYYLSVSSRLHS
jgi:hypothetical protein